MITPPPPPELGGESSVELNIIVTPKDKVFRRLPQPHTPEGLQ